MLYIALYTWIHVYVVPPTYMGREMYSEEQLSDFNSINFIDFNFISAEAVGILLVVDQIYFHGSGLY